MTTNVFKHRALSLSCSSFGKLVRQSKSGCADASATTYENEVVDGEAAESKEREKDEAERVATGRVAYHSERERRKESAQAAERADESCHRSRLFRKKIAARA